MLHEAPPTHTSPPSFEKFKRYLKFQKNYKKILDVAKDVLYEPAKSQHPKYLLFYGTQESQKLTNLEGLNF